MDSGIQKSILQMARGAIQERADYEMSSLLNNILDPNTSATAARKLTITLTLKPDDTRQNITISRRRPLILTLIYRYFQSLTVMRPVKMPRPHLMRWRPVSPR